MIKIVTSRFMIKIVTSCFMIKILTSCLLSVFFSGFAFSQDQTIRLHPDNAHYFQFRGKPTILITSAEHYGSVINLDFDYSRYLDELRSNGLNYTRIFSGAYVEVPGDFGITNNTLSPKPMRFVCPWKRSNVAGYKNGGNKFDLDAWDEQYFKRLKDFVSAAAARGIVVEMTLFSALYSDAGWSNSPLHAKNNINLKDSTARKNVQTLDNGELLRYQEAMVRKIVAELSAFDNVIYEIQNEPWADFGVKVLELDRSEVGLSPWQKIVEAASPRSLAWQKHIVSVIVQQEATQNNKHLIAQNFTNFQYKLSDVNPDLSILNFHYALPLAALENYGLNKVIGFDESGFSGDKDETYRQQAWRFIMSGGGLFNNLDYSFSVESPEGTTVQKAPGGGSRALREQLKVLKDFIESFEFVKMRPVAPVVKNGGAGSVYQLAEEGRQYAFYVENFSQPSLSLNLPKGNYRIEVVSVTDGVKTYPGRVAHKGGDFQLHMPLKNSFALRIVAE